MKKGYTPINSIRQGLYKINEAANLSGTTPRALRHYEQLGLLPGTKRSRGQIRLYCQAELSLIKKIKQLQAEGLALEEIKIKLAVPAVKSKLKVFIDSTFSITPEEAALKGLEIIPMNIHFGKTVYKDYFSLAPEKFQEIYSKKYSVPTTSAPSIDEYMRLFGTAIKSGSVLSLHADARLASSYSLAKAASQQLGAAPLEVIDTKLLPLEFREFYEQYQPGMSLADIKKLLETIRKSVSELYIIDWLDQPKFDDQFFKLFYGCYPLLQHTAKSGLVPVGRFESFASAETYLKNNSKSLSVNQRVLSNVLQVNFGCKFKAYFIKN